MTDTLTSTQIKFIKACKAQDTHTTLLNVHRNEYYVPDDVDQQWEGIARVLADIVTKFHPNVTISRFVELMDSKGIGFRHLPDDSSYSFRVSQVLLTEIRHMAVDQYPGFPIAEKNRGTASEESVISLVERKDGNYSSTCGWTLTHEKSNEPYGYGWVLKRPSGQYVDNDRYRHDIESRHSNIKLVSVY